MTVVTKNDTIAGVREIPELKEIGKYLMFSCVENDEMDREHGGTPLGEIGAMHWDADGTVKGLNNLIRVEKKNRGMHFVYSGEECADDPWKREIGFLYLEPEEPDESRPFVVLCAGGGYQCVCTMVESAPVGAALGELGYKVFLVNYRVGGTGVLPNALDDLAASIRYIRGHADEFGINPDNYIVGGFSAGGNLTCTFGMAQAGYKKYGLPKPKALFPVYPVTELEPLLATEESRTFLRFMFGEDFTEETAREYSPVLHAEEYPPCYTVCCRDDSTVDAHNTAALKEALDRQGIANVAEIGETGEHGFGLGTNTDVEGWVERAAAFERGLA